MIYKWKPGTRIKADPALAAQVMNQLADESRLDAENLVEVSKPTEAVLHDDFEWDNDKAANEFRKHQARNIINGLLIVKEEVPEEPPIRCYFKIEENTSNYTPIQTIVQSADSMAALKTRAINELNAYRQKFDAIVKYCDAEVEFNNFKKKMETSA